MHGRMDQFWCNAIHFELHRLNVLLPNCIIHNKIIFKKIGLFNNVMTKKNIENLCIISNENTKLWTFANGKKKNFKSP
jgi:hypothetical protein